MLSLARPAGRFGVPGHKPCCRHGRRPAGPRAAAAAASSSNGHSPASAAAPAYAPTGARPPRDDSGAAAKQPLPSDAEQPGLPLIRSLLHVLTDKNELAKLQAPTSIAPMAAGAAFRLQQAANALACCFGRVTDCKSIAEAEKALDQRLQALCAAEAQRLVATPTSAPDAPALVPLLYYAVAAGSTALAGRLLDKGASADAHAPFATGACPAPRFKHVPPLALALARGDHHMVHLLLARGASPWAVPAGLFLPPMEALDLHSLPQRDTTREAAAAWCQAPQDYELLQAALGDEGPGLKCSYWLTRAAKLPELHKQAHKVLLASGLQRAPELRLAVIGQEAASSLLFNAVVSHISLPDEVSDSAKCKPLVLLLAGPPGHGKTFIAQQMERVLCRPFYLEDCSRLSHLSDMWAVSPSFQGSERAPPLADFLRTHSGKPSVVVLDEVEKMQKQRLVDSLLRVFEEGTFIDQHQQRKVDCRQAIFLLTTNSADRHILNFWEAHSRRILACSTQPSALLRCLRPLEREIRGAVASRLGRSLTSRLSAVVPFLPFTKSEAALVAHEALLTVQQAPAAAPIEAAGRVHGHIQLSLHDQVKVCSLLGAQHYCQDEGARAVNNALHAQLGGELKAAVLEGRLAAVGGAARLVAARAQRQEAPGDDYELHYG